MRRQIIVVFFSLFWLASGAAFGADRGALFKVTGKGHTMHLFGTMHLGVPEFYPLEPRITRAVAEAATLALEIDPAMAPAEAAAAMREYGLASPGASLPPPLAARLAPLLQKAGMDPAALAPLKPWVVAIVLAVHEFGVQGFRPDLGVDAHLATLALAGKAKVVGLESAGSQMALFSKLTEAEQLRYLEDAVTLVESGKHRADITELTDAWRKADRAALDALALRLDTDATFSGRFTRDVLLAGRNVGMTDKLAQLLERENKAVAAIGLLHLIGKGSVPELLRAKGLTVERVY
ncbi:TraB/GumN family protein [Massilia eurypsychrophila]|uniref:TraB/GumN family protein n=1 Tax=Massilia eurypsychrophila TaxID=1485217 RepID=A0A2G8TLH2_9BURK|nr:TraB/GumN family protein [Massilia eurypsychrophila]PIL46893.1 TraB/GumN family protein [Massilia eurypsychrophila]